MSIRACSWLWANGLCGKGWLVEACGAGEPVRLAARVAAMKDADLGSGVSLPADGGRCGVEGEEETLDDCIC